jgi:thiamine biosynthesis protein ThiC
MTQLEIAKKGIISPQMEAVARAEGLEAEFIRRGVEKGTIVIPANTAHSHLAPCGIGEGLSTKVNAGRPLITLMLTSSWKNCAWPPLPGRIPSWT